MRLWWREWKGIFGEPSEWPAGYWYPMLGDFCGLTPATIGELDPGQMLAAAKHARARARQMSGRR